MPIGRFCRSFGHFGPDLAVDVADRPRFKARAQTQSLLVFVSFEDLPAPRSIWKVTKPAWTEHTSSNWQPRRRRGVAGTCPWSMCQYLCIEAYNYTNTCIIIHIYTNTTIHTWPLYLTNYTQAHPFISEHLHNLSQVYRCILIHPYKGVMYNYTLYTPYTYIHNQHTHRTYVYTYNYIIYVYTHRTMQNICT